MKCALIIAGILWSSVLTDLLLATPASGQAQGQIAFASDRDGDQEIFVMNADGSALRQLTFNDVDDRQPAWSPDGTRIAFATGAMGNNDFSGAIAVMNADGGEPTILTSFGIYGEPAWSPDGTRIVYSFEGEVYLMEADGANPVNITNDPSQDGAPAWSPDGAQIAFVSNRARGFEFFIANPDGANIAQITDTPGGALNLFPAWSPDGSQIAFFSDRDGSTEIYVMAADGSNQVRLTDNGTPRPTALFDKIFAPAWSPDGAQIAFYSTRDGNGEIYVMGADGADPVNITNDASSDGYPAWFPGVNVTAVEAVSWGRVKRAQ